MQNQTLRLLDCTPDIIEALLQGEAFQKKYLQVNIAPYWSNFGTGVFDYALSQINQHPETQGWWMYLVIHKDSNTLIGTCGYKGLPDDNGAVEIGYEIAPAYRGCPRKYHLPQGFFAGWPMDLSARQIRSARQPN